MTNLGPFPPGCGGFRSTSGPFPVIFDQCTLIASFYSVHFHSFKPLSGPFPVLVRFGFNRFIWIASISWLALVRFQPSKWLSVRFRLIFDQLLNRFRFVSDVFRSFFSVIFFVSSYSYSNSNLFRFQARTGTVPRQILPSQGSLILKLLNDVHFWFTSGPFPVNFQSTSGSLSSGGFCEVREFLFDASILRLKKRSFYS